MITHMLSFQVKSDNGRFGTVMMFVQQSVPLRNSHQYCKPIDFAMHSRGGSKDAKGSPQCVDHQDVARYLFDRTDWAHFVAVLCIGAGLAEIQYYSGGCQCQRQMFS